ncbi:MAG: carboxylating nicotinate-nucleotide diphosphorylase [Nanoarchaeota archaeon]|nr:carboxylating nicotinate-nucleotide diphosphorylase [Nanoarchaeota archaeon]
MNRGRLLNKAFNRGYLLTVKNKFYKDWIHRFVIDETKADVEGKGDITSDSVLNGNIVDGVIYSRNGGIVAGIEEVCLLLRESEIKVNQLKNDGDRINKGTKLLLIKGNEKDILKSERPILDILSRMSGIATLTHKLVSMINDKVPIASTRKIEWRYLDKKAVYVGSGYTHRLALWESILIKDNHLDALRKDGVKDAIGVALGRAWKKRKNAVFIEVETGNEKEAIRAAEKFKELNVNNDYPCFVMLDNMEPSDIKGIIGRLRKKRLLDNVLIEVSGGITPENVKSYSTCGADVLSLGYLTTAVKSLDMKLRVI